MPALAMKTLMKSSMKKAVVKTVMKKPSSSRSGLSGKSLANLGEASLDDKIALYQKKGADNIDGFLSSLSKEHRESLWQRFKYARQQNQDHAKKYDSVASGPKSTDTKKTLLNLFIKLGQTCKGQPYVEALTSLTFAKTSSSSSEWVPLNTIMKKYGMQELMRRVNKGSVLVRADPNDPEEYEFQDIRKMDIESQTESHTANVQKKDKIALEDYMKARSSSSLTNVVGAGSAAQGFLSQLKNMKPEPSLKIQDGDDPDEEDDAEQSAAKALEAKAELLTQFKNMGPKGKSAAQRVDEMLNVMKELIKAHPKNKDKDIFAMINKRVLCLMNLKKNKKLDLDTCKNVLMDAAQIIKKVNQLG